MNRSQWLTIGFCALLLALVNNISSPVAQERVRLQVDDSQVRSSYANVTRVTGTVEEVILDFGLNPDAQGAAKRPVKLGARVVINFFTAKRLAGALQMAIQRHEKAFGPLETDPRKRLLKPTSAPAVN